jgi:hypothetical protein
MSVRCLRQDKQVVRTLLANERAALDALLACDFDGAPELRRQAATVMADGIGLIINLVVDSSIPGAPVRSRAPVEAPVYADDGVLRNGLILFVDEGRLSGLEYWWTTDEMPGSFPPPARIGPES